jgi:hypothetical protein
MGELGRRVKEDSERLVEQARSLRSATAASPRGFPSASHAYYEGLAEFDGGSVATGTTAVTAATAARYGGVAAAPAPARHQLPQTASSSGVSLTAPPPPRGFAPSGAAAADGESPLADLYDPEVIALFDRHKRVVYALWQHYSNLSVPSDGDGGGTTNGVDIKR